MGSQTERAAAIIDRLRMFARLAEENPSAIDPGEAILGALELMGEQLRLAQIEVVLDLAERGKPSRKSLRRPARASGRPGIRLPDQPAATT